MKLIAVLRTSAIGIAVLVLSWFMLGFLLTEACRAIGGADLTERLVPARSAHLLEEAQGGTYSPVRDTPFLVAVAVTIFVPMLLATYFTARVAAGHDTQAVFLVVGCGLALELLLSHELLDPGFPSSIRLASLFELLSASGAALLGWGLISTRNRLRGTEHRAA